MSTRFNLGVEYENKSDVKSIMIVGAVSYTHLDVYKRQPYLAAVL